MVCVPDSDLNSGSRSIVHCNEETAWRVTVTLYSAKNPNVVHSFPAIVLPFAEFRLVNFNNFTRSTYWLRKFLKNNGTYLSTEIVEVDDSFVTQFAFVQNYGLWILISPEIDEFNNLRE